MAIYKFLKLLDSAKKRTQLYLNNNFTVVSFLSWLRAHAVNYSTPSNLTYAWGFGSLLLFYYMVQIFTGIWLTSYYSPSLSGAFDSVILISQQVKYGSFIRNVHANGATMMFFIQYLHIVRNLYFMAFQFSAMYVWFTGLLIFLLTMATAFIGYVLPWGQMSFWGVTVITSLLTAIPVIGVDIQEWVLGGHAVNETTLRRFYGLHIVLPIVIGLLIVFHLLALHRVGSTSATQVKDSDKLPFFPYFIVKDIFGILVSLIPFTYLVFFDPFLFGHPDNFTPANPMVTPPHIVPEWYFMPFYAILRAFPNKTMGAVAMLFSLLCLGIIPFFHKLGVKAFVRYRSKHPEFIIRNVWPERKNIDITHRIVFSIFCFAFVMLVYLGGQAAEDPYVGSSRFLTFLYFFYFLVVVPTFAFFDAYYMDIPHKEIPKRVYRS